MAKSKNGSGKKGGGSRRSRAESSTGKKADQVEMRKAASLDLPEPVELSSDDFKLHYRAIKLAKDSLDRHKSLYDGCCKQAKKVSEELLAAVKLAIQYEGKDPEDIRKDLEIRGFVLKQTGSYLQLTLHDTLAGDVNDQAYKRGLADGKAGRSASSKYPEGSDLAEEYGRGWRHGTAENMGMSAEQADAAVGGEGEEPNRNPNPSGGAGDQEEGDTEFDEAGEPEIPKSLDRRARQPELAH